MCDKTVSCRMAPPELSVLWVSACEQKYPRYPFELGDCCCKCKAMQKSGITYRKVCAWGRHVCVPLCTAVATNYVSLPMHTRLQPRFVCFVSSEEGVLVCAASAKARDAPELSSLPSQGGETVFLRNHSPVNSFSCHFCAAEAVEVSTLHPC